MSLCHLHFVGIAGVGMCGPAEVPRGQGMTVSGRDVAGPGLEVAS